MTSLADSTALADAAADVARYLPGWLGRQVAQTRTPGAQVAIRLGGRLIYSGAFGLADADTGQALRADHIFRVASHSKWFTTTMVMRLIEQGMLRLDDTLGDRVEAYDETPLGSVTLRDLLCHRAGVIRDGTRSDFWQLDGEFLDASGLLAQVRDHGKVFEPHEYFKYTNIGFSLVGQVIESVTDVAYPELMLREVCRPLELTRTMPEFDPDRRAEFASGHGRQRLPGTDRPVLAHCTTGAMAPATGFCSTAEELTAFATIHAFGDDHLIGDSSRRQMQHPISTIEAAGTTGHYGLGTQLADLDGRRVVGHSGGFPGHITRTWVDPTCALAVSVLTNAVDGPADQLATGIVKMIGLAAADHDGSDDPAKLRRFTGRYESLWGTVDVVLLGRRLVAFDAEAADPVGGAEVLDADDEAAGQFTPQRRNSYRSCGEPFVFTPEDGESAGEVRITGQRHQRVEAPW